MTRFGGPERDDFEVHLAGRGAVLHAEPLAADALVALAGTLERGAKFVEQSFARHLQDREARLARRRFEIGARLAPKLDDLELGIDHGTGRRVALHHDAVGFALHRRSIGPAGKRPPAPGWNRRVCELGHETQVRRDSAGLPGIDAVPLVQDPEQFRVATHGFRVTQNQEAVGPQRVMEHPHDPSLQRCGHVDQHIAAEHQIQFRERGIARDVLLREDADVADPFADPVVTIGLDEETAQSLGRDVRADLLRIGPTARLLDGVL